MATELAYALITPYSLLKSRTGGIIGRLLARSGLELVGARLYTPSDAFIDAYRSILSGQNIEPEMKQNLVAYLEDYVRPQNRLEILNRAFLLLLKGDDAIARLKKSTGSLSDPKAQGDTVRGTYGEFVKHFEPAVFISADPGTVADELRLFAKYANVDGGVLDGRVTFPEGVVPQTTLVILKPENFKPGSSRPGNIIDMFSRTGLYIVGARMLRLSLVQAEEFYGPLRTLFIEKLKRGVVSQLEDVLRSNFEFPITDGQIDAIANLLKDANARHEFYRIVQYMSGRDPYKVPDGPQKLEPGTERSLALLYHGPSAIQKIRETLGSTNPAEAAPGTVRSVYAAELMKNAAHASDSPENAERERRIVGLLEDEEPADIAVTIEDWLSQQ
jgi:nucleoside diphosphate kinase